MQTTDAILIVLILFAIIIVAILIAQPSPRRIKIAIKTLLGDLDVETEDRTDETPPPDASSRPHIKARDIKAKRDALVHSQRGDRNLEFRDLEADRDATIFDEVVPPDSDPNPEPPA
jgi:hypothetical protein